MRNKMDSFYDPKRNILIIKTRILQKKLISELNKFIHEY